MGWLFLLVLGVAVVVMWVLVWGKRPFIPASQWRPLIIGYPFLLMLLLFLIWPSSPWGLGQREVVLEQFMTHWREGDTTDAVAMMLPLGSYYNEDDVAATFRQPEYMPMSWTLPPPNSEHNVIGEMVVADGTTKEVIIRLVWQWPRMRWAVSMVIFGDFDSGIADIRLFTTFMSYSNLRNIGVIVTLLALLQGVRLIRRVTNAAKSD